jgi:hypothetical protein
MTAAVSVGSGSSVEVGAGEGVVVGTAVGTAVSTGAAATSCVAVASAGGMAGEQPLNSTMRIKRMITSLFTGNT